MNDALVANWLVDQGHTVQGIPWTEDISHFQDADLIVVRSTWDYPTKITEFHAWLDAVSTLPVANPVQLMRWNSNKKYLLTLQDQGIAIPRTQMIESATDLAQVMEAWDVETAVVKPTVGASGKGVDKIQRDQLTELIDLNTQMLVQEFVPEISGGEYSLAFFAGEYSHTIIKKPKAGEFRINSGYGGSFEEAAPPRHLVQEAQAIVDSLEPKPLYVRVDCLVRDERLLLLELELVEPSFFFLAAPEAAARFGQAIVSHAIPS